MERANSWTHSVCSNRFSCFSELGEDADIEVAPSLNEGQIVDFYEIGDEISHGNFGITFCGTEILTGDEVVVKEVKKLLLQPVELNSLHKELSILTDCVDYPGIVKLKCWFEEPNFFYLVTMKPLGGKILDGLCREDVYGESLVKQTMKSLLTTVQYLQSKQISHRGINPESVILPFRNDVSQIALTNFAFATHHDDKDYGFKYYDNNPAFAAPEVLRSRQHDPNCDVWSLGVMCFLLLSGVLPYDDRNPKKVLRKIKRGQKTEFPDNYWFDVSAAAMDFTSSCLTVSNERPNATELLNHMWFKETQDFPFNDTLERLRFFKARRARNENLKADALWDSHLKNLGYSMTQVLSVVVIQSLARQWLATRRTSRFRARSSLVSMNNGSDKGSSNSSLVSIHSASDKGSSINGASCHKGQPALDVVNESSFSTDGPPQFIPGDYRISDMSTVSARSTFLSTEPDFPTLANKSHVRNRGGAVGSRVSGDVPPDTGKVIRQDSDLNSFSSHDSRRRGGAVGSRVSGDAPPELLQRGSRFDSTSKSKCVQPSLTTMLEDDENEDRKSVTKSGNIKKSSRHRPPPPPPGGSQKEANQKGKGIFGSCKCN